MALRNTLIICVIVVPPLGICAITSAAVGKGRVERCSGVAVDVDVDVDPGAAAGILDADGGGTAGVARTAGVDVGGAGADGRMLAVLGLILEEGKKR